MSSKNDIFQPLFIVKQVRFLGAFFMQTLSKIILTQIKGAWTFEACVFHSETAFRDTYGKGAKLEALSS